MRRDSREIEEETKDMSEWMMEYMRYMDEWNGNAASEGAWNLDGLEIDGPICGEVVA